MQHWTNSRRASRPRLEPCWRLTDRYLSSYPYLTSAPLHVYAGMLCFYLAQPESSRRLASDPAMPASSSHSPMFDAGQANRADRAMSSPVADDRSDTPEPPTMSRLRTARGWFVKALELDRKEAVSLEFLQLVSSPSPCLSYGLRVDPRARQRRRVGRRWRHPVGSSGYSV